MTCGFRFDDALTPVYTYTPYSTFSSLSSLIAMEVLIEVAAFCGFEV
jgi:hypothetical protein